MMSSGCTTVAAVTCIEASDEPGGELTASSPGNALSRGSFAHTRVMVRRQPPSERASNVPEVEGDRIEA